MKRFFLLFVLAVAVAFSSAAQEGMWLLSQIGQLDLAKKGLKIPVSEIYDPAKPSLYNAILQLGGGSASFVSPEGLVVTNHHVAFTALQRASSVESDFLTNGFLAANRAAEIQAPGYQARLLLEMTDVTKDVEALVRDIKDPLERDNKITAWSIEASKKVTEAQDDQEARIVQMYNGRQYIKFVYKVFKDIRIVYAPPLAIGNYGGEVDNWMWPRHTGDFSFLRVYVTKDGKGAEYNAENVPYKPKVWLKVATDELKNGDFTFVLGFPGFTTRYRSSTSVQWNQDYNYPFSIRNFKEIIGIAERMTENDPEGALKVANLVKGLSNVMKNYQGKVDGMKRTHFLDKKIAFEKEFQAWAEADPTRKAKYADILAREKKEYEVLRKTKDRDNVFGILNGLAGMPLNMAIQTLAIAKEMAKPEAEREPGFDQTYIDEVAGQLQYAFANYYEPVDKAMFLRALKMTQELAPGQRLEGIDRILASQGLPADQFADKAYAETKLKDIEYVKSLLKMPLSEMEALNDPFMKMAVAMYPVSKEIQDVNERFAANVTALRKVYLDALYEWKGTGMYPDANGTMRFTWGPVKGYRPADAVAYDPVTSLTGVVDKNKDEVPFNAPKELVMLSEKRDFGRWVDPVLNDVPVAFLSQCDITGGNSGSPIMNAKGEIIGVVFDGNYEAMISDWQYDYALQRTISVDIRYVLFIAEKFGHAGYILDEMGIR